MSENRSIVGGRWASLRVKLGFINLGRLQMMTRTLRTCRGPVRAMAERIRAQSPCRQRRVVGGREGVLTVVLQMDSGASWEPGCRQWQTRLALGWPGIKWHWDSRL